ASQTQMVDHAAEAEAAGFSSYWVAQLAVPDALTVIATMGTRTSTIELGTAVIPTWPRHPLMLAGQALTVQEAIGNRLALGIGLAHKSSVESTLKVPFATPAKHMDEYLSVLLPAMIERSVSFTGDIWSGEVETVNGAPGAEAPGVLLAAADRRTCRSSAATMRCAPGWPRSPRPGPPTSPRSSSSPTRTRSPPPGPCSKTWQTADPRPIPMAGDVVAGDVIVLNGTSTAGKS